MTRFWILTVALLLAMLLLFFVVQALQLPFLAEDTSFLLSQKKWVAALAGVGLLLVDVIAPVPSSIVMLANGMLFGMIGGTLLSVVGGLWDRKAGGGGWQTLARGGIPGAGPCLLWEARPDGGDCIATDSNFGRGHHHHRRNFPDAGADF
jgi:hypothetical protein